MGIVFEPRGFQIYLVYSWIKELSIRDLLAESISNPGLEKRDSWFVVTAKNEADAQKETQTREKERSLLGFLYDPVLYLVYFWEWASSLSILWELSPDF